MVEHSEDLLHCLPNVIFSGKGFSAVGFLLSKQRDRLNILKRGDLRLLLNEFQLDAEKLIIALYQAQPSHLLNCHRSCITWLDADFPSIPRTQLKLLNDLIC